MGARGPLSRGRHAKRKPSIDNRHPPGRPTAPTFLCAEAKREWKRVCDLLASTGKLTDFDLDVLIDYTATFAMRNAQLKIVAKLPAAYTETERGAVKKHPDVERLESLQKQTLALRKELGFSPYARERLSPPAVPGESQLKIIEFAQQAKHRSGG